MTGWCENEQQNNIIKTKINMNKQWKSHMKCFMVEKQYPCSKCGKILDF